jgi:hypothetical protein
MKPYVYRRRWGDNDRNLGPLTFAAPGGYKHTAVVLSSGDDEGSSAAFRISLHGWTAILALPRWLVPTEKTKVYARTWDAATVERLGRDWYWDEKVRQYGFSLNEGHVSVYFGRQTHDSSTEQTWGWFLPWTQWRHVRHSLYDLGGALYADMPQRQGGVKLGEGGFFNHFEAQRALEEACPSRAFTFKDFDGEELTATTRIEEREWLLGEKGFKWLSWFATPKIHRSLDIHFSGETGQRKGSWKGGTIGHSINMAAGELHEAAFRRYCGEHGMTFVAAVESPKDDTT